MKSVKSVSVELCTSLSFAVHVIIICCVRRCEQPVLTWLLQRGYVWTEVLQQVLVQASSAKDEVWGSLLDHTHDAALWSAARGG